MASSIVHVRDVQARRSEQEAEVDQLKPAKGVALGCMIGAGIWAGLLMLAKV